MTKPVDKIERDKEYAKFAVDVQLLAQKYGFTSGNCMLNPLSTDVDEIWSKIAHAIGDRDGILASSCSVAKVSPTAQFPYPQAKEGTHLICIYCDDSYNRGEVAKVAKLLSEDLGFGPKLAYKVRLYPYQVCYKFWSDVLF